MFITPNLHSQNLFEYWGVKWRDYQQEPKNNLSFLHRRFFRDTVKVAEMKEAFSKYKNVTCYKSVYEGFDSVYFPMEGHGSSIMLISPLRRHPDRKVRESRGVWSFPRCVLVDIFDKHGLPQKKLIQKLDGDAKRRWLSGEMLRLEEPRWYFGLIVSPCIYWNIFHEGESLASVSSPCSHPDFFSYAAVSSFGYGGSWDRKIKAGAHLLGLMCATENYPLTDQTEHTFAVLVYEKSTPEERSYVERPYTTELLESEQSDKEVPILFKQFKLFIESLPRNTFRPYYTSDFRVMNGRYYRITVNKCGWLVEDFLSTK